MRMFDQLVKSCRQGADVTFFPSPAGGRNPGLAWPGLAGAEGGTKAEGEKNQNFDEEPRQEFSSLSHPEVSTFADSRL